MWVLKGSNEVIYNVHREGRCLGYWCTIHNPMPGPWADWPMRFIGNAVMVRICPHGFAHPCVEDVINLLVYSDHDHYCDCECGHGPIKEGRHGTTQTGPL